MSQKSLPAHRDYPDAEPSYDDADQGYDAIDADPDGGDQCDVDGGYPALDVFPSTLFDDLQVMKPVKAGPGHGDS